MFCFGKTGRKATGTPMSFLVWCGYFSHMLFLGKYCKVTNKRLEFCSVDEFLQMSGGCFSVFRDTTSMDMKDWNLDTSMRQAVGRSRCELWVAWLTRCANRRRRVGSNLFDSRIDG